MDKKNVLHSIIITVNDNEATATPGTSVRKTYSKGPRKKSVSFKNNTLLGTMLENLIIVNVLPKPRKETLLPGTMSTKNM